MTITELKNYLQSKKNADISETAQHFGVECRDIENYAEPLIRNRSIRLSSFKTCKGCKTGCSGSYIEWIG